ncbi:MAG: hypothetical protein U9R08_04425 [Nanoarchaeota archaeon]|nr:hypothetical protein [Nanoarchaeota archaeon]
MRPEIMSETPIGMAEMKKDLELIKKRDGELNFRANKTEEYLNLFAEMSPKKVEELRNKLNDLNVPRLKPLHIIKIVDLLPETVNDLKVILQGYTLTLNQENMKKILGEVAEYLKPAK